MRKRSFSSPSVPWTRRAFPILGQGGIYGGNLYSSEQMAGVNGGGTGNVNYQMDGSGHNDTYVNMNLPFPNPDALQEFNLQTTSMSAQWRRRGVVNIVAKSGTNSLHGSVFIPPQWGAERAEFLRAHPGHPEAQPVRRRRRRPDQKDQLFFFATYQGTQIRTAPSGIITFVPTRPSAAAISPPPRHPGRSHNQDSLS